MNILIFNLNPYGKWPCGLVNKYLAKVYALYGIVPPTPVHIHKATAERIRVGMDGYFDDVSIDAQKRWREIQKMHKGGKGGKML